MPDSFVKTCLGQIFPPQPKPYNIGFGRIYLTFPDPIEGTSATLSAFPEGGYKRQTEMSGTIEYLPSGNTSVKGICSEPLYIWDLSAYVTEQDLRLFQTLTYRQDAKRRSTRTDFGILLDDLIQPITESEVSPFRSVVPGAESSTVSFAQTINYYGRFKVLIPLNTIEPIEKTGQGFKISFKAHEYV